MQAQRLNITLPYEIAKDLRRTIPAKKRSRFIAESIRKNLPKRDLKKELIKSLKANYKFYKEEGKLWDVTIADGLDKWS